MNRNFLSLFLSISALLLLFSVGIALTAANSVSTSGMTDQTIAITANQLKPTECAGLNLTNILIVTSGVPFISTGNSNDLIIGTAGADDIKAGKGQDCVVGGGGDDTIDGNQGNDVLMGGAGNDTLDGNTGSDSCYGGGGADTFSRCEITQ